MDVAHALELTPEFVEQNAPVTIEIPLEPDPTGSRVHVELPGDLERAHQKSNLDRIVGYSSTLVYAGFVRKRGHISVPQGYSPRNRTASITGGLIEASHAAMHLQEQSFDTTSEVKIAEQKLQQLARDVATLAVDYRDCLYTPDTNPTGLAIDGLSELVSILGGKRADIDLKARVKSLDRLRNYGQVDDRDGWMEELRMMLGWFTPVEREEQRKFIESARQRLRTR